MYQKRHLKQKRFYTISLPTIAFTVKVTRWVCETIAQNVAQSIACQKKYTTFPVEKVAQKITATSVPITPKTTPIGKNSPNLVTLFTMGSKSTIQCEYICYSKQ
jgi:hypothetical protein